VVGLLPSAKGALDKLDLNVAGVSTTWLTGQGDPRRALDPRYVALMQSTVDGLYGSFTQLVATARDSTPEKIHELAQGRVWSGKDALAHGLVDRLGSQGDAVAAAITRAKLPADTRIVYVEPSPGRLQQLLQGFGMAQLSSWLSSPDATPGPTAAASAALHASLLATGLPLPVVQAVAKDLAWLAQANPQGRPFVLATHCLCAAP
jgi:protease IV